MKAFTMRCEDWIVGKHVRFSLFDSTGANCGKITIRSQDAYEFIAKNNWNGAINWNHKLPLSKAELMKELKNIANAKWEDFTAEDFLAWVKSRASHAIAKTEATK